MEEIINIYCDESCHLQYDNLKSMILGGIICPQKYKDDVYNDIKEIKKKHNLLKNKYEMKWTKISKSKLNFYSDIIDYFFQNKNLRFRGLIIPNKSILKHELYNQSHDKFYYKMYYDLLNTVTKPPFIYQIYLDIKDTQGLTKIEELKSFLPYTVKKIQEVRSHEVELVQLADIIIGAISYYCREDINSVAKFTIMNKINKMAKAITNKDISETTNYCSKKFNILRIKLDGDESCE